MASSKSAIGTLGIAWPDFKFPPINLWVVASLPKASLVNTRTHRRQRPGLKRTNALHKNLHRRLESILAVRGGKR